MLYIIYIFINTLFYPIPKIILITVITVIVDVFVYEYICINYSYKMQKQPEIVALRRAGGCAGIASLIFFLSFILSIKIMAINIFFL